MLVILQLRCSTLETGNMAGESSQVHSLFSLESAQKAAFQCYVSLRPSACAKVVEPKAYFQR